MKTQTILSALGIYIVFMFVGHNGPLSHHKGEDQPHTHNKHVVKLIRGNATDKLMKLRRDIPLTV